ncbi:MAG: M20/M25/M40 family metallo-hydrolase [Proteobacteria bacterium]|nr:M20/M25/M40 family metallo-hydrolase [Pseudomonadota bacterium]
MHSYKTLAAAALAACCGAASAGPLVWISLDTDAYALLTERNARMANAEHLPMVVADRQTQVVLTQVDADALEQLSADVHERLHRCGGFIVHANAAEGRQAVARARAVALSPNGLLANAAAPSYALDDGAEVNAMLPLVQESEIRATINQLTSYNNRYYKSKPGTKAATDLATRWQQMAAGRSDITVETVTHVGYPQKSVVMTVRGTTTPDDIVVIGGHLDSVNWQSLNQKKARAPGADDNASGIATLTEVARVMLQSGYHPKRTLQFMAYAAEEVGLKGSADIANQWRLAGKQVVGVMQLDMTNFQGSAYDINLINDYTNAAQNTFLSNIATTYLPTLSVTQGACGYACSDHASWTSNGYAASFPFEAPMGQDNQAIHTKNDTLAKSGGNADHAAKFARLALAYAIELGSD